MVLYRYNIVLEKMGINYRSIYFPWIPFCSFLFVDSKNEILYQKKIDPLFNFSRIYLAIIGRIIHI